MRFRTEIDLPEIDRDVIRHDSIIWTIGSCFADNVGDRLLADGFDVEVNPLGTLYNPLSILSSVSNLVRGREYTPADLFPHEGKFRSYDFHSLFSRSTAEETASFINSTLARLRSQFSRLNTLILTLGSARCFKLKTTGQPVANCHKQHPDLFSLEDLTVNICVEALSEAISLLERVCPNLSSIILTVSPIRHKAYGLHVDKLSKATLLLAAESLVVSTPPLSYFPSYEIMMDDLRDYRFYAADMIHPSEVAVDYIYDRFKQVYCTPSTRTEATARLRAFRRTLHRPS